MIEFLIVAPFLLSIFLGILFFIDVQHFVSATQVFASNQGWKGAGGNEPRAFDASDEVVYYDLSLVRNLLPDDLGERMDLFLSAGIPSQVLDTVVQFGTFRNVMILEPVVREIAQDSDSVWAKASAIYIYALPQVRDLLDSFGKLSDAMDAVEELAFLDSVDSILLNLSKTPYEKLTAIDATHHTRDGILNYDRRALALNTLDWNGQLEELGFFDDFAPVFRNRTFLRPIVATINWIVGSSDEAQQYSVGSPLLLEGLRVPARVAIMHDPHSIYWRDRWPSNGGAAPSRYPQRLRQGDRLTILGAPWFSIPLMLQTMISGNLFFLLDAEFPVQVVDEEAGGLPSWIGEFLGDLSSNRFVEIITGVVSLFEQAQPLRKYDKNYWPEHDLGGQYFDPANGRNIRYGTDGNIAQHNRLRQTGEAGVMEQIE